MKPFNLSEWALDHKSLLWYFMIVLSFAGYMSYLNLGREEDPNFAIKTMIISAQWPGATAEEVTKQVTDRIEKKLQEIPGLDFTKSVTTGPQTIIFVNMKDTVRNTDEKWLRVRNLIGDIKGQFPAGVQGPFFNDGFGDVYGNIYAFTSDGLTKRQLRDFVEDARSKLLTVPNVGKIEIIGAEDEVVYIEFSPQRLASYGIDQQAVINALKSQNAISPSGMISAGPENVMVRVSGQFTSEDSIRDINVRADGRFFRLSDVATITRDYKDPPSELFSFNGEPAIALAIGMIPGANLLKFGEALNEEMQKVKSELPIGVGVHLVSDQPEVVEEAVSGFTKALMEAVAIVLVVSFISLGVRAGLVVAISIPLVLAITFIIMEYADISLQRISLGALIIALGLLVDDAMIAVEMMVARLEAGDNLRKAATYVYTSTAFPMLTGTLVTVASFIPVGLNSSAAGEFVFSLFVVIGVSLTVSWVVAVLFTPLLGVLILPKKMKHHAEKKGIFTKVFSACLYVCMRFRWLTIMATIAAFAASLYGMQFVQQQFFPSSDRPEILIDWQLPQSASIEETSAQMAIFEQAMLLDNPDIEHWSSYAGRGAARFILTLDVKPNLPSFGQMVIVANDLEARDRAKEKFEAYVHDNFIGTDAFVKILSIGPPVGRPIQYRVSGPDLAKLRSLALKTGQTIAPNPNLGVVGFDWNEPSRVVRIDVLQDKARALGISSQEVATALNGLLSGTTSTQIRDNIYLIPVIGRAEGDERTAIETLPNIRISTADGRSIPISTIAKFHYGVEQPVIWSRNRVPTITVSAGIKSDLQPATVAAQLKSDVDELMKTLPAGYHIVEAGAVAESAKAQGPIAAVAPAMLFIMATILMFQLQSISRLFLVFAVAPLALVGVVIALLLSNAPMGFVAILGILALIGILIRNSVILIVQIETLREQGMNAWDAVVDATEKRMRPIILTAAAASLALIPIASEVFWGPMAYAMMGGIIVGTILTLLFLPALYIAWFRIKKPNDDKRIEADKTEGAEPATL